MDGEVAELPDPLRDWVRERAAETGLTPSAVLARAAAAYRLLEETDEELPDAGTLVERELKQADPETVASGLDAETLAAAMDGPGETTVADAMDPARVADELDGETIADALDEEAVADALDGGVTERVEQLIDERLTERDQTAELQQRVDELEAAFDEKIDDVRSRVIQVKREADAKAAADHDHPELHDEVAAATDHLDELATTTETLEAELDRLAERVTEAEETAEAGFDNYETILRRLKETTSELQDRTETLGTVASRQRERLNALEASDTRRSAVEDLQEEANEKGVTKANCGSCGSTVQLGLLGSPRCPHCDAPYEAVDADTGLFRAAKLAVADRPALASPNDDRDRDPEPVFDDSGPGQDVGPEADDR